MSALRALLQAAAFPAAAVLIALALLWAWLGPVLWRCDADDYYLDEEDEL